MVKADAAAVFDCPAYRLPFAGAECARRFVEATEADDRDDRAPPGLFWCARCPAGQDRAEVLLGAPDNICNEPPGDLVIVEPTTATPPGEERRDTMGRRIGNRTAKGIGWSAIRHRLESPEPVKNLAAELGCSETAVRSAMARLGVVRRQTEERGTAAPTTAAPDSSVTPSFPPTRPAGNAKRTKLPRLPGESAESLARANATLEAFENGLAIAGAAAPRAGEEAALAVRQEGPAPVERPLVARPAVSRADVAPPAGGLLVVVPPPVLRMLDRLVAVGLWGDDRAAVLRSLAQERLQELARGGVVVLP